MDCLPAAIARASRCWCFPANAQRAALLYLLCQILKKNPSPPVARFSYEPPTALISWTDTNGSFGPLDRAAFFATADVASVSSVTLNDGTVTSVSNLSLLPALTTLVIGTNLGLTLFSLAGCTVLTNVDCSANALTTLDVNGLTALVTLNCGSNVLTTLDVSGLTSLVNLFCSNNLLTSLNVSGCTGLNFLSCDNNALSSLDFSTCTALVNLDCFINTLTSLNVTGCSAITHIVGSNNVLTTLDISTCTALVILNLSTNTLSVFSINTILSNLVSHGHTGGYANTANQTPAAPPSVGPPNGIVAKAALLAEVPAWTVLTD